MLVVLEFTNMHRVELLCGSQADYTVIVFSLLHTTPV